MIVATVAASNGRNPPPMQSATDLDVAYSPAMGRLDASASQIATAPVIVTAVAVGIAIVAVGIVISRTPKTETKAAATETATMEATAMETAAMETATATMTAAAAMTSTAAMGKRGRAGCAEQDRRCADNTEATDGE
jgi:hypothetical protein